MIFPMKLPRSIVSLALVLTAGAGFAEEKLSFNKDVRPILSDKCFFCHGPDKNTREADLRLDIREDAIAEEAFVPGDIKKSELYWRITETDEDEIMPPPDSHKELSKKEIAILTQWIKEGAEYEDHWSWLPVTRPEVSEKGPAVVDHFIDERLKKEKLERSPKADPITLARRLSFDIVGLPPTPDEVKAFQEQGIESYVDRLLASPHFGERMAIEWLDAVRYADSVGYHGDQTREASPFRDYVIQAFNENKPFDQFTIEQIAGDLLPDATMWQQVAAGYNRLNQVSAEGGIQDGEYVAKYQAERVRTTSTAWLGTTLACAECHDHKFDPFLTKDFYSFAAFFSDILEKGAYTGDGAYQEDEKQYVKDGLLMGRFGPELQVPTPEEKEKQAELTASLAAARKDLNQTTPELKKAAETWATQKQSELTDAKRFDYLYLAEKGEKNEVGTKGWSFVTVKDGKVYEGSVARKQQADGNTQHIADGKKKPLVLAEGDVLFSYVYLDPDNPPTQIMLQFHHEKTSWSHRAWWGADDIPYAKGAEGPTHHRKGDLPKTGEWVRLEVPLQEVGLKAGDKLTQLAFTQFGGLVYWDASGIQTSNETYRYDGLEKPVQDALKKQRDQWTEADSKAILENYRKVAPELQEQRNTVAKLSADLEALKKGLRTVPATVSAMPRQVRVLPRGNWMDETGEVVRPGSPHFLPAHIESEEGKRLTRLDLANWMVNRENPLTARTYVNRLWARFFGEGFSSVLNDLGSQGEWPTHPQLLDWLSAEFMESGWDVKHLIKTIVMSETYQQSSMSSKELAEIDPYNRLLSHQSPVRLSAELIRDNALAVSGLLNPEIGGRSAKPNQPSGYYQHLNFPRRE